MARLARTYHSSLPVGRQAKTAVAVSLEVTYYENEKTNLETLGVDDGVCPTDRHDTGGGFCG